MTPEEIHHQHMDIRFVMWQAIQFSLNDPEFIADIKRQTNSFQDLETHRIALSRFGISDEQIDQFLDQIREE